MLKKVNLANEITLRVGPKVKQVFVTSHERSGTHFLMNVIDKCQDVYKNDYVNFDYLPFGSQVNFYSKDSIKIYYTSSPVLQD